MKFNEKATASGLYWRTPSFNFETSDEPVSEIERERAFLLFLSEMYPHKTEAEIRNQSRMSKLKIARQTLQLSVARVATKMKISETAYNKYEQGELIGTISLSKLEAAAEALGCELFYGFRAQDGRELISKIWEPAFEATKNHGYLKKCVANRRPHALNRLIIEKINDPKFRRKMGWTKQRFDKSKI